MSAAEDLQRDAGRLAQVLGIRMAPCIVKRHGSPTYAFVTADVYYLAVYETHVHYKLYDRPGGRVVAQGTYARGRRSKSWIVARVAQGLGLSVTDPDDTMR